MTCEIIQRLVVERINRGWSLEKLSRILGYDRDAITRWEKGETSPALSKLQDWCEVFEFELKMTKIECEKKSSKIIKKIKLARRKTSQERASA